MDKTLSKILQTYIYRDQVGKEGSEINPKSVE